MKDDQILPGNFGNLEKLEWVVISEVGLVVLPESLGKLKALKILDLKKVFEPKPLFDDGQ